MDKKHLISDSFDENQSIHIIKEMIQVSQKKLKNDGVLFLVWGWIMFYNYLSSFLMNNMVTTFQVKEVFKYIGTGLIVLAIIYSIYYIFIKHKKVTTYISISLRYVWLSLIICLSLTNVIMFRAIEEYNVALQHPVFMIFIAFAIVITGGILRYRLVIIGGIIFGMLAYLSSYLSFENQMLCEAIAWLIAFIIPGHYLYATRKS